MLEHIFLPFNLSMSLLTYWLISKWYIMPKLTMMTRKEALTLLLLPHTIRHIGLIFLLAGVTAQELDVRFAHTAVLGDLFAAVLAYIALIAIRLQWKMANPLIWVFNIIGLLDLFAAMILGLLYVPSYQFGAAYFLPALIVPMLLMSHFMIFKLLLKKAR